MHSYHFWIQCDKFCRLTFTKTFLSLQFIPTYILYIQRNNLNKYYSKHRNIINYYLKHVFIYQNS